MNTILKIFFISFILFFKLSAEEINIIKTETKYNSKSVVNQSTKLQNLNFNNYNFKIPKNIK